MKPFKNSRHLARSTVSFLRDVSLVRDTPVQSSLISTTSMTINLRPSLLGVIVEVVFSHVQRRSLTWPSSGGRYRFARLSCMVTGPPGEFFAGNSWENCLYSIVSLVCEGMIFCFSVFFIQIHTESTRSPYVVAIEPSRRLQLYPDLGIFINCEKNYHYVLLCTSKWRHCIFTWRWPLFRPNSKCTVTFISNCVFPEGKISHFYLAQCVAIGFYAVIYGCNGDACFIKQLRIRKVARNLYESTSAPTFFLERLCRISEWARCKFSNRMIHRRAGIYKLPLWKLQSSGIGFFDIFNIEYSVTSRKKDAHINEQLSGESNSHNRIQY